MIIKILGSGCKSCVTLANHVQAAVNELGIQATIEKVEDFATIAAYGVMRTPALVVNEQVVSTAKVLSTKDVKALLDDLRA